jgi:hypothetical protein
MFFRRLFLLFLGGILRVHCHGADGQHRAENGATGDPVRYFHKVRSLEDPLLLVRILAVYKLASPAHFKR